MAGSIILPGVVFVGVFVAATAYLMTPMQAAPEPASVPAAAAAPAPAPVRIVPPPQARDQHFSGCRAAHAAGRYSIPAWDPSYRERMDGDRDGFACEPLPRPGSRSRHSGRVRVLH